MDFCYLPLKRFAVINCFDDEAAQQTLHFVQNPAMPIPFEIRMFDDLTSAYNWLVSAKAA